MIKNCKWCNSEFKQTARKRTYCSRNCFLSALKKWGGGARYEARKPKKRNPRIKAEYKKFMRDIMKKAEYKCEICGAKATDIHHKIPVGINPTKIMDRGNVIAVCLKCHRKKHKELPDEFFKHRFE